MRRTHCWMGYPYYYAIRGMVTGSMPLPRLPACPFLFIYGRKKNAQFHSQKLITVRMCCDLLPQLSA
jgi:hypothetical protein